MKNLIYIALLACFFCVSSSRAVESIAFYYAPIDSVRELINYDRVVVEPANISASQIQTLHKAETQVFAYISIGEFSDDKLPDNLLRDRRTENKVWKSDVMDLTGKNWQAYLFQQADKLMDRGFDGLFLDTLDSYQLFAKESDVTDRQESALIEIIEKLDITVAKNSNNDTRLILNRGFEVEEQLKISNYIVVAESLHHGYSPSENQYFAIDPKDTEWLTGRLKIIKSKNIEVVIIDYIKPSKREEKIRAARTLLQEGYTPYVSDGNLHSFGTSTIEPIAKRVLGFFDSEVIDVTHSECHRLLSMPLEYFGFVPECVDIQKINFKSIDIERYAAVYFWFGSTTYEKNINLTEFIAGIIGRKPILFIGDVPRAKYILSKLGLSLNGTLSKNLKILSGAQYFKQGLPHFSPFESYPQWMISENKGSGLISLSDGDKNKSDIYIEAKWGGVIFDPLPIISLANKEHNDKWLIDPFQLLKTTLRLPEIPVADITTESGRRIMTSHIDGDGFASRSAFSNRPYASRIILDKVLKKRVIPQTVSIIEGEIGQQGMFPNQSPELENIARAMFELPHIEVASHTFSHPFYWDLAFASGNKRYGEHLPIPNYELDYQREIIGTVDYINNKLLKGDKKVEVLLWSGNADPTEDIVEIADGAGLLNVNGGNTYTVEGENNIREIWPAIMWHSNAVQVYAPVLNENIYTNLWTEHFDGYRRVIETFKLLGSPRRIKPVSVYYHMYSGVYPASLESLDIIYDWTAKQKLNNLYLSEYAMRAKSLYETGIARTLDGDWQVSSTGVRSVRLPLALGSPNSNKSSIYGWQKEPDGRYLSVPLAKSIISLEPEGKKQLRLNNANAQILKWNRKNNKIEWQFLSHLPLEFDISNLGECTIESSSSEIILKKSLSRDIYSIQIDKTGLIDGSITCPSNTNRFSE